jgi:diguanylate cyclase (GGDEF)-like protein
MALHSLALVTCGESLEGMRVATVAHAEAQAMRDAVSECEALLASGFALQSLEQHARAIEAFTQVERLASQAGDRAMHARAQRRLGVSFSVLGRHEQAAAMLAEAAATLHAHGSIDDACHAEYSLITAESRALDAIPEAGGTERERFAALTSKWLDFAANMRSRGKARLESMATGNAGIAARRAGQLDLALNLLTEADGMHEQSRLASHRAITQSHLGEIHLAQGRTAEGIEALLKSITLMGQGRPRDRMDAWDALAVAYENGGDAARALAAMKEARALERKLHDEDALLAAAKREQRAEIARMVDEWSRLADQDALTGLPNRRAFDRRLTGMVSATQSSTACSLILFDLDHFKRINDTHGHATGDLVLKRFSALLSGGRRAGDLPARIGGEEFALLLEAQLDEAREVAERVRAITQSEAWSQIAESLGVTLSAGVACSTEWRAEELSPEALFASADRRLYVAKHLGRNRVAAGE